MKGKVVVLAIRLIVLIAGIGWFVRFFIPIPLKGVMNIGNITGMICSAILILYGLFFFRVNHGIGWLWHRIPGKIMLVFAGLAVVTVLSLVVIETVCMVRAVTGNHVADEAATLVVLGAKAHVDHPSELLQTRLDATITYMNEHPNAVAVLSGGQGEDEPITEAQCMFDYLTGKGIPAERLYLEEQSRDTKDNLTYSMELIRKEGLNTSIVLLTNEFHEYRATMLAKNMSLNYSVYAADTPGWALPTYYVRELYGILHEWLEARL